MERREGKKLGIHSKVLATISRASIKAMAEGVDKKDQFKR